MAKRLTVDTPGGAGYEIVIQNGFDGLPDELDALNIGGRRLCIVTDSNVGALYAGELEKLLAPACRRIAVFSFPAGEASKNLDTVRDLYRFLIQNGFDRRDMLLALGGGVVGDLTGYAAATYLRGVDFIQIPTTLLAQVDSSIGGKTGVDFDQYKNMVGAFHMPRLVYMNPVVLRDLDDRQYANGMAEILKHGLIKSADYYEWLIARFAQINERDAETIECMVCESCRIKRAVVERDPMEKGERALLNFGHTLGHAIEKYEGFSMLHGECVALGCIAAAYISWKRDMLSMEEYYEIRDMFVPFGLPISLDSLDIDAVVGFTKSDKKMESGRIKFILLQGIGNAVADTTVTEAEMREALSQFTARGGED